MEISVGNIIIPGNHNEIINSVRLVIDGSSIVI